jgi:hypothetical protein
MSLATTLLTELAAAGMHLVRDGNTLRVEAPSGATLDPFRERIRQHKPALLAELLQADIIATVDVEPAEFDRQRYDDLWARWHALHDREGRISREPVAASVPPAGPDVGA